MARNGISYDDVKQAIDEMQSMGLNPTIAGLREKLGTGSFTTISEHLKRWRSERQQQPMVAGGTPAPNNLSNMVQAVWQQAREDATKELESYKQEIQKTLENAEAEKQGAIEQTFITEERNRWLEEKNNKLSEAIRLLEKQAGLADARIEHLQEEKQELKQSCRQLTLDLKTSHQQLEQAKEAAQTTLKQQQAEFLQQLQQVTKDQQQAFALLERQITEERVRSEASEQHWINQVDSLRRQLKEQEQKLEQREREYREQQKKRQRQQEQQQEQQQQLQHEIGKQLQMLSEKQARQQQIAEGYQLSLNTQQKLLAKLLERQEQLQQGLHSTDTQIDTRLEQLSMVLDKLIGEKALKTMKK